MNANMNKQMGATNDNRNGCGVRGFMRVVVGGIGAASVMDNISNQMGVTMFAKFYIRFRNLMNDEHGTTTFETMIITLLLLIVVVICFTALAGFVDNADGASKLLGID